MQIKREKLSPTSVKMIVTADQAVIDETKNEVLKRLAKNMKLPGFRPGKAPLSIVERSADASVLQTEFLDSALNRLYGDMLDAEKLRPVGQPKVAIQKFVPFDVLEVSYELEVVGDIKLPDYKKMKVAKQPVTISDKDINDVVESLRDRMAERKEATRAAAAGDEVVIDFVGTDAKTNEPIKGADGTGYPLILGSDTFIPGFEANIVGMKAGEQKSFTLTFPKEYGVKALQSRKVTFAVTVQKVSELVKPKVDDAFAAKVGPFKTAKQLKDDIRKQLTSEKQAEADRTYENQLLEMIADKTIAAIPVAMIDGEVERAEQQIRQNLAYRGQTWQEYLDELGQTEDDHRVTLREPAERRVKAGLALGEVADKEGITVTPEEFQIRMQLLKGQYTDKQMQAELEKPESARQVLSNMLTEKTIAKLMSYAEKKEVK